MKSTFFTEAMTALPTLAAAIALMGPSLAHANEGFVCKLTNSPAFGITVTPAGPKIPHPTEINNSVGLDPFNTHKQAVVVTFFGPRTLNLVQAEMTTHTLETRAGPETSYFIDLGNNEKILLDEKTWVSSVEGPYSPYASGTYETSGKNLPLTCK